MKRYVFLTAALSFAAGSAFGALGDVINSFPAPDSGPMALAVAGDYNASLWVYCQTGRQCIYRISGEYGLVYSSFTSPQGNYTSGLTFSYGGGVGLPTGEYLWMGNSQNDYVYRCRPSDGYPYTFFPAGHDMTGGLAAMAIGDGGQRPNFMASSQQTTRWIYRQSLTNGSIYSSFEAYTSGPVNDLAWDWRNMIIWTGSPLPGNVVCGFRSTGSFVGSFTIPALYPRGFAYTSNYLWVSTATGSHRIWMIHCPYTPDFGVEPASMGRIKATFR